MRKETIMKSAVLIIDVQCGLYDTEPRPFEADEVVQRINTVTEKARSAEVPVIFVLHESGLLVYKSKTWELQPGLIVRDTDVKVRKTTPDSFLNTNLEEVLTSREIDNLLICGYASEFCVDTTTRRAAALGYDVQLVSDAHTTHDKPHASAGQIREHHNATLPDITSFGATISLIQSSDINLDG